MPKAEQINLMPLEGDTIQQSDGGGNHTGTGIESTGKQLGCKHYSRGCKLVCPLCSQAFWCRFCHDEVMAESGVLLRKEAHKLPRHKVSQVVCGACEKTQPVAASCRFCGHQFGNYTCLECRLFDNDDSKQQFHCDSCGICRVGGKENFWHCQKCGCCLCNNLRGQHRCVERTLHQECAVCMDYLFDSTKASSVLQCGHTIHAACLEQLITIGGRRRCPICSAPFGM